MRQSHRNVRRHGGTAVLWGISFLLVAFALLLMTSCDNAKAVAAMADFLQPKACPATPAGGKTLLPEEPAADALPGQAAPVPEVELQLQNPELPNGCEVTSLAMVLSAQGYPADKVALAETSLPREEFWYDDTGMRHGPDPDTAYAGDPASQTGGWYCLEGPIVEAANDWIAANGGGASAYVLTGMTRDTLDALAQAGTPLAVWVTREYAPVEYADYFAWQLPDGSNYTPYNNLHCVVLAGEQDGMYRIADPLNGWQQVDPETFWQSFSAMGCRAVAINPD